MEPTSRKIIKIPEITRVEGHAAVVVNIAAGRVQSVELNVFEGTRFFEKIVLGHKHYEIPHITSRVCAICSTGHVIAAIIAMENAIGTKPSELVSDLRELMHLGMIIESHSTHLYALALPDYVGAADLLEFATHNPGAFESWNHLRKLGSAIQTVVGGRAFHPVNLQVGGFSRVPLPEELAALTPELRSRRELAIQLCEMFSSFAPRFKRKTTPIFLALIPSSKRYGYFGNRIQSTEGWEAPVEEYKSYLSEVVTHYSHAKRSTFSGKSFMVGSLARLNLNGSLLSGTAKDIFDASPIAAGDTNTIWNNLGQAIEIVQAIDRCLELIAKLQLSPAETNPAKDMMELSMQGEGTGAIECPRGTLYHWYSFDNEGTITGADMVTPSAQNTARIELDVREVVEQAPDEGDVLQSNLETLIRAYDPCNTCATHMVALNYSNV